MSYSTPVPATADPTLRQKTLDGLREKKAMLTEGEWIGIGALVAVTLVASLVVAIFAYYLITDAFTTGTFSTIGWAATGGGLLLLFFMVLFTTLCGGAMGLAFKGKSSSLTASVGVALLMSVVLYWAFRCCGQEPCLPGYGLGSHCHYWWYCPRCLRMEDV